MTDVASGMTSGEAYAKAKRMAKYGHCDWLVWKLIDGTYCAAKLSQQSLEAALAECVMNQGKPVVVCVQQNTAQYVNVSLGLAEVWMANMKAGTLAY